jgi:outer membrane protein insertion porin family
VSEYTRLNFDLSYKDTELSINTDNNPPLAYIDWVNKISANGSNKANFKTYNSQASYSYDSRNRAIFPDSGVYSSVGAEFALPGGDLEYYKLTYRLRWYIPFTEQISLMLGGEYGYGDGYGDPGSGKDVLPFFENFYAGGTRSVRGYKGNTIGPRDKKCADSGDSACRGDAIGGNEKILGRAELFFPVPFTDEPSRNFRLSAFLDAGRVRSNLDNIFNDENFRATYGVAAVWITPVGALTFNWAWPIHKRVGDETERFQFNIGTPF